jgi:EmrB/QacA subfamily drug resistance transporter
VLCIANFLVLLDTTIVNTAVPDIMSTLSADVDDVLWVLDSYLIAFAALLILFGRLGDVCGPRTLFVLGLGVFTATSVLCALSTDTTVLVAGRVGQGIGSAMVLPQALVLIAATFPPDARGTAFGLFTAVAGVAAVSGPLLGGLLITAFGWRWVFLLNIPIGVVGLVLALRLLPEVRSGGRRRFDGLGAALAAGGLLALVYGLVERAGPVWYAVAAVLLGGFVLWERRHPEPLVPFGLFRDPGYRTCTVITFVSAFALSGFLLAFVVQTQQEHGMSPLMSGLTALPWTLALSAVAPIAGRLADRIPARVLLGVSLAVHAAGVIAFLVADTFLVPLLVVGIGQGAAIAPATTVAMRRIPPDLAGAASGVLNTARQVGAALGAAVVGAVVHTDTTLVVVSAALLAAAVLALFSRFGPAFGTPGLRGPSERLTPT